MKKIIPAVFATILVTMMGFSSTAQVTTQTRHTFYYYPASNIYYDIEGKQYLFNDHGTWTTTKTLPSGVVISKTSRRVTVYHPDKDVWIKNGNHAVKYKNSGTKKKLYKHTGRGKKH